MKNKFIYVFTIIILATFSMFSYGNSFAQEDVAGFNKLSLEGQCDVEKEFTQRVIERVGYCAVDEECEIMNFGCPFGCNSLVSKKERVDLAKETVAVYYKKCGQCEYKCKQETRKPKCIFGRCSLDY